MSKFTFFFTNVCYNELKEILQKIYKKGEK